MLETTFQNRFIPGTNLKGDKACADWRFLLPSLRVSRTLCLGTPPPGTLNILMSMSDELVVACPGDFTKETLPADGNCSVEFIRQEQFVQTTANQEMLEKFDLIWATDDPYFGPKEYQQAIELLTDFGLIYAESKSASLSLRQRPAFARRSRKRKFVQQDYWLTPLSGELRTAVPVDENKIGAFFFQNVLHGITRKTRVLSHIGSGMSRIGLQKYMMPRRATLLQIGQQNGALTKPPAYILRAAGSEIGEIENTCFGFSARGKYNSNKVLFYLFSKTSKKLQAVVKITRSAEFNFRLENERTMLTTLGKDAFYADRIPRVILFGYHNQLVIMGLQAVTGFAFRAKTTAEPDCRLFENATEWLIEVGARSAGREPYHPTAVQAALFKLFEQFNQLYELSQEESSFLREQIAEIGAAGAPIPSVVQHGDPGIWNLLGKEDGRVVFLDWESGEMQGMPLWDLFYFTKSYFTWAFRKKKYLNSGGDFYSESGATGAYWKKLIEATHRYCLAASLDAQLIEPLFYTCWMHRALKESARLNPAGLGKGQYFNLLKHTIKKRDTDVLKALFSR